MQQIVSGRRAFAVSSGTSRRAMTSGACQSFTSSACSKALSRSSSETISRSRFFQS